MASLNLLRPPPTFYLSPHTIHHRRASQPPPSIVRFPPPSRSLSGLSCVRVCSTRARYITTASTASQTLRRNPPCSLFPLPTTTTNPHRLVGTKSSSKKAIIICKASANKTTQVDVPAKERLMSAIAYHIPFLNGLGFGIFLLERFPILELAFDPIVPLFSFYKSLPFHNIVAFIALCFGVARDRRFSRYVRRNALQATMVDVLLALPTLLNVVLESSHEGLRFQLLQIGYSAVFVGICIGFVYAVWCTIRGKTPHFPFITEAVDWQIYAVDRQS